MDPLQWMGAVRTRVQTADKNISVHNIAFSSEKVISPESGEKYTQIRHCLQANMVQNHYVSVFWCERTIGDIHFYCRKRYYGLWTVFRPEHTRFPSQDVSWWTGVVWITCELFLSAVWTLTLTAPIHCRGSIGIMLTFSKSILMKKHLTQFFGQTISFSSIWIHFQQLWAQKHNLIRHTIR